jgi:hypothetical protein
MELIMLPDLPSEISIKGDLPILDNEGVEMARTALQSSLTEFGYTVGNVRAFTNNGFQVFRADIIDPHSKDIKGTAIMLKRGSDTWESINIE